MTNQNNAAQVAEQPLPSYGKLPFDQLGRDVTEATMGVRQPFDFGPNYPGHAMCLINFNSLARIVDKYRLPEASAPVTAAEVMEALHYVDDFIARCNGNDRGSCESVNVLRRALASAPVAEPSRAVFALEHIAAWAGIRADLKTHKQVREHAKYNAKACAAQASAPIAGEPQPVCWIERAQLESVRDEGNDAWVYWRETGHAAEPDEVPLYAAPQASKALRNAGIEQAAAWVDKRRQDFDNARCHMESETGAWSFGRGDGATAKEEYSAELAVIAEGLRTLKTQADKDGAPCSCPSGDGSLRHPCAAHPPRQADKDDRRRPQEASDER